MSSQRSEMPIRVTPRLLGVSLGLPPNSTNAHSFEQIVLVILKWASSSCQPRLFFRFVTCMLSDIERLFLLLLPFQRSQLYLWGSRFWVRVLCVCPFFNQTTEVATFRLRGQCLFLKSPTLWTETTKSKDYLINHSVKQTSRF